MSQKINYFVTYFTSEFTEIGVVSIKRFLYFHPDTLGKVYCFDENSREILSKLIDSPKVTVENVQKSKSLTTILGDLVKDRSLLEAIISIKPLLLLQCITECRLEDTLIYFDPDVMFYSQISIENMCTSSFMVYEQKGISSKSIQNYGRYNAGIVLVKNNSQGNEILRLWQDHCLQWCRLEVENHRYADQKYLDYLSGLPGFTSSCSWSSNLSARAFNKQEREIDIRKSEAYIYVNGEMLESFHFHGLRYSNNAILTGFNRFGSLRPRGRLFFYVYLPVIFNVFETSKNLMALKLDVHRENLAALDKTMIYERPESRFPINGIMMLFRMLRLSRIPSFPIYLIIRIRQLLWNR